MTAVNPKWHEWIFKSVANHFHVAASAVSLPLVVETLNQPTDTWKDSVTRSELMVNGVYTKEGSNKCHEIFVPIFIIISTHNQPKNLTGHFQALGKMAEAADTCIIVKEYEKGVSSPETVGELIPYGDKNAGIKVETPRINRTDQRIHATITASYQSLFNE